MKKILFVIATFLICLSYHTKVNAYECVDIQNNLKKGIKNNTSLSEIGMLQNFLYEKKYLSSKPNGFFGVNTLKAVKDFQKDNNISPTGKVGPITRSKIKEITCKESSVDLINETSNVNRDNSINQNNSNISNNNEQKNVNDAMLVSSNDSRIKIRTDGLVSVDSRSITVRGVITSGAYNGIYRWFEVTKNPNNYMSLETKITKPIPQSVNNIKFQETVSDLDSNTNYYFRACAGSLDMNKRSCGGTTSIKTNN